MVRLGSLSVVVAGIAASAILRSLWGYVRRRFPAEIEPAGKSLRTRQFLEQLRPWAALAAASAVTALLLVAFLGDSLTDPRAAVLAGYAWDSTLQKLR